VDLVGIDFHAFFVYQCIPPLGGGSIRLSVDFVAKSSAKKPARMLMAAHEGISHDDRIILGAEGRNIGRVACGLVANLN